MSSFAIDCKLIHIDVVLRVEHMQLGHILDNFPQEVTDTLPLIFVEGILEHHFALFIEPHLKNIYFGVGK
jgi:hypothetical protein